MFHKLRVVRVARNFEERRLRNYSCTSRDFGGGNQAYPFPLYRLDGIEYFIAHCSNVRFVVEKSGRGGFNNSALWPAGDSPDFLGYGILYHTDRNRDGGLYYVFGVHWP